MPGGWPMNDTGVLAGTKFGRWPFSVTWPGVILVTCRPLLLAPAGMVV